MATAAITRVWAKDLPAVPAGRRLLRVFDTTLKGFFAEIDPRGGVGFRVRYSDERGRRCDMKIGRLGEISVEQARTRAREIRALVALGNDPAADRDRRRAIPTVAEFVAEQYAPHVREHLRAADDYLTMLRLRILPAFGRMGVDEVGRTDIVAFRAKLIGEGLSNGRINRHLAVTRRLFALALEWGVYEGRNPAQQPRMLREESRELFLSDAQLRDLMLALDQDSDRPAASAVALLVLTGCRKTEIIAARWENVDLDQGQLTVPLAKAGRRRFVPLSPFAVRVFAAQPRSDGQLLVFPSARRPGQPLEGLRGVWTRVKAVAKLPEGLRLHDLRHTYASVLINRGATLHEVARLLGHSQLGTTQRYAHLAHGRLIEAASQVGSAAGLESPILYAVTINAGEEI